MPMRELLARVERQDAQVELDRCRAAIGAKLASMSAEANMADSPKANPSSVHDVKEGTNAAGEHTHQTPNPHEIPKGTKPPEQKDAGDRKR
jgi:hypothetical protein